MTGKLENLFNIAKQVGIKAETVSFSHSRCHQDILTVGDDKFCIKKVVNLLNASFSVTIGGVEIFERDIYGDVYRKMVDTVLRFGSNRNVADAYVAAYREEREKVTKRKQEKEEAEEAMRKFLEDE